MFTTTITTTPPAPSFKLDEWDIKFIKSIKQRDEYTIEGYRRLWAERCDMELCHVDSADLVQHLADLIQKLNLGHRGNFSTLINDAHADSQFRFQSSLNAEDIKVNCGYYDNWLRALVSCLRLTEVSKLPGWPTESN